MLNALPRTALCQWKEQIASCRDERLESEDQAWQRMAEWYGDWVRHNDYVALVLPRLLAAVDSNARVLEVGPGSGAFTIPLARAAREVVAVEPSANMRAVLAHNLACAGIANGSLVPQQIEDAADTLNGPFDLAFASYSLYNVEAIDRVVRSLVRLSHHVVAWMGTGERRDWYRDLFQRFRGRELVSPPQLERFYPVLLEMGIYADVDVFWTTYNYVYNSEDALLEWWLHHFHLPESERLALRNALMPLTEWRDGKIGIYRTSRAALVWIERGRNA